MKQITLLCVFVTIGLANVFAQHRYVDSMFTYSLDTNIVYGQNFSVLTGTPILQSLVMDIYSPANDAETARPLIVYMHPGDFYPPVCNGGVNGSMHDSAVVEMCKSFAERGYVVANIDYRLGWDPTNPNQDCRAGTLYRAVYRGLQDAKTCVRYLKMNFSEQGNTYGIDTGKIVVGGQGSAGYIATSYATLNDPDELTIPKLYSGSTDGSCGCTQGVPYVVPSVLGDFDGLGGDTTLNNPNWPNYSSNVEMVFNMEGGLGDTSWMEPGEVPMVSFHDVNNPLTPYNYGYVFVPLPNGTILLVTDVAGSHTIIRKANELGNNNVFHIAWTDPYSVRANAVIDTFPVIGYSREGLFPIVQPDPGAPWHGQTSPWEWWSCTDLELVAPYCGQTAAFADAVCANGLFTNPNPSKAKGLRYIDTVQNYLDERICLALGLCNPNVIGIHKIDSPADAVSIFPNPSSEIVNLRVQNSSSKIVSIKIYDLTGRKVFDQENSNQDHAEISCRQLEKGLFTIQIQTEKGTAIRKLVIE